MVDLDLFNTTVVDFDGLTLYLPNGKVFGEMIVNMSQSGHRRIELVFGVDHDDDLNTALRLLIECAQANQSVLNDPPPWAKVISLGENAVNVTLRCWASSDDYVDARFDLTKAIKETLAWVELPLSSSGYDKQARPREGLSRRRADAIGTGARGLSHCIGSAAPASHC